MEFDHFFDDEETIRLFAKINVNDLKRPKRGYTLSATGLGVFKLEDQGKANKQLTDNFTVFFPDFHPLFGQPGMVWTYRSFLAECLL